MEHSQEPATEQISPVPQPRIDGNLDTAFLKLIAILSMLIDHALKTLAPDLLILYPLGRLAFPIFAYCLAVGCLYTHDIKRYLLRLAIFAVISQPFYVLAFHPTWQGFTENILNLNIFFTLTVGVAAIYGLKEHKMLIFIAAIAVALLVNIDYGIDGVVLILVFFLFREKKNLSMLFAFLLTGGQFFYGFSTGDWLHFPALQGFSALALPLIYLPTHVQPKIPKMFFYIFYPAHLLLLFLIQIVR